MKRNVFLLIVIMAQMYFAMITIGQAAPEDRHLPYMAGETWWCSQDWFMGYSHSNERAWDFNWGSGSSDLGMPLLAPARGVIEYADNTGGPYGIVVLIKYNDATYDRIAHNQSIVVFAGESVEQGQVVSFCGSSGSDAVHIHIDNQSSANPGASGRYSLESYFYYCQGGIHYYGCPRGCDCMSTSDPQYYYTSLNSHIFDLRYNEPLHDSLIKDCFGDAFTRNGILDIHWYHPYVRDDYGDYDFALNTYVVNFPGAPSGAGFDWHGAIVYDALGGAKEAYVVGWNEWNRWHNLDRNCNPSSEGGIGGPNSCLYNPISNSYWMDRHSQYAGNGVIGCWRQDFQGGESTNSWLFMFSKIHYIMKA